MKSFGKKPSEQFPIDWEFNGLLPPNTTLVSAAISAIDVSDNSDQSATVLLNTAATVAGTRATFTVRAGTDTHKYKLTILATLAPAGVLNDDILMVVGA